MSVELGNATREDLPQLVALLGVLFSQEAEFVPDDSPEGLVLRIREHLEALTELVGELERQISSRPANATDG